MSPHAKSKVDYVVFLLTHIERIPEKFLKHIVDQKGLYELRIEAGSSIFRVFCCFDKEKLAKMTQEQLADRIGAKKSFISRIENGQSDIQLSTLYRLLEVGLGKKLELVVT